MILRVMALMVWLATMGVVSAQQPPSQTCEQRLAVVQEQLADVRGAVTKIHLATAAFQAETLVTLDRKLTDALAKQAHDAATIAELQKELAMLKPPQPSAKPADEREQ